jgi:hypothetical protein
MLVVLFHTVGIVSCGMSVLFWYLLIREQRLLTGTSRKMGQLPNPVIRPQRPSDAFPATVPSPLLVGQATGRVEPTRA